jgi:hypothetical protein
MIENFQARASEQGKVFEETVATLLRISGWSIVARNQMVHGVEVDIIATDTKGVTWWIECKGSWHGRTPGSKRGDTVKKAIAVAWYLSLQSPRCPYMLITSHLPNPNTVGRRMLDAAQAQGLFAEIRAVGMTTDEQADDIGDDE